MTTSVLNKNIPFTALDRCDRCGAQAKYAAKKDDNALMFCGHHYTEYADSLSAQGFVIFNDSNS